MPIYLVEGANKETGESVTVEILAGSDGAARAEASRRGFLTSSVFEVRPDTHPLAASVAATEAELRQLRVQVRALANSNILKNPIATITGSILLAALVVIVFAGIWGFVVASWRYEAKHVPAATRVTPDPSLNRR